MLWKLLKNKTLLLYSVPLIALLLLSGCNRVASSTVCPPLVVYPPEFQKAAAKELAALPAAPHIDVFLQDYAMTRDQLRVCQ